MTTVKLGDVGTRFIVTVKDEDGTVVDLQNTTVRKILFLPPGGAAFSRDASILNAPGTDGKMAYTTVGGDIAGKLGTWKVGGYIEMPAGKWYTSEGEFEVKEPILTVP